MVKTVRTYTHRHTQTDQQWEKKDFQIHMRHALSFRSIFTVTIFTGIIHHSFVWKACFVVMLMHGQYFVCCSIQWWFDLILIQKKTKTKLITYYQLIDLEHLEFSHYYRESEICTRKKSDDQVLLCDFYIISIFS